MISASWGTRDVGRTLGEPMLPAPPRCYCISLSICSLVLQPAWLAWDRVGTYTSRVGAVALVAVGAFADNTGIDVSGVWLEGGLDGMVPGAGVERTGWGLRRCCPGLVCDAC
jgi:predicted Rdx family selenoprotein